MWVYACAKLFGLWYRDHDILLFTILIKLDFSSVGLWRVFSFFFQLTEARTKTYLREQDGLSHQQWQFGSVWNNERTENDGWVLRPMMKILKIGHLWKFVNELNLASKFMQKEDRQAFISGLKWRKSYNLFYLDVHPCPCCMHQ